MKKGLKIGGMILLAVLIIIQFFRGDRPEFSEDNSGDIHNEVVISSSVSNTLRTACYDCHSNETVYPWYASVAPVSWWLFDHIEEGSEHLNFSEWNSYSEKRKHHKMEELIEEVEEGEMPLNSYTWAHRDAVLTPEQKEELIAWAKDYMGQINPEN